MKKIEFHEGHFDVSGFVKLLDDRIFYFRVGDIRWSKFSMLVRTAEHFKDWTGGSNDFVSIDSNFKNNFFRAINVEKLKHLTRFEI
jgi:hypothetical protein